MYYICTLYFFFATDVSETMIQNPEAVLNGKGGGGDLSLGSPLAINLKGGKTRVLVLSYVFSVIC